MGGAAGPSPTVWFSVWALLLGVAFGAAGFFGGAYAANAAVEGFQIDWFAQPGQRTFPGETAAMIAGLAAASLALVGSVLGATVAAVVFDRVAKGREPSPRPGARTRETNLYLMALLYGLGLPLLIAGAAFAYAAYKGAPLSPRELRALVALGAAFAGAASILGPLLATAKGLMTGSIVQPKVPENLLAKVALGAARNPKVTIALVVALTLVAGFELQHISTNVDVADTLPRGDPNTEAAKNLTSKFKSTFTQQVTFMVRTAPRELYERDNETLPHRETTANRSNISDEVYVRALDNMSEFMKNFKGSPFVGSVSVPDFYRLINWTVAGATDKEQNKEGRRAFSLPGTDREGSARYRLVDEGVWIAVPATADAVISPDFQQTSLLLNVDPQTPLSSKEIGAWALRLREEYIKWAESDPNAPKVFTGTNTPKFSVDLPVANAHSSELAQHDFKTLVPIIAGFIILCLFIAFRSAGPILISFSALAVSVTWTFGAMSAMNIPLNTLNLTVIPLIMGVGIDYGIHMMNEYLHSKSKGMTDEEAFRHAGSRGALALFVATANTVAALLVMVVSPSLLIAQLGLLSAIAITSSYVLAITLIPAALVLMKGSAKVVEYRPSPLMAGIARTVSRGRIVAVIVLVGLMGAAYAQTDLLQKEAFGDPPRNWLPDDPLRVEHEEAIRGFYSVPAGEEVKEKANVIIFEGDITRPEVHRYMDRLEDELRAPERDLVVPDTLRTLPFLIRTYLTVKDGLPGAGADIGKNTLLPRLDPYLNNTPADRRETRLYPETREEINALMDEIPATPLDGFANLFYDYPAKGMAIMLFSVKAGTYDEAEAAWNQVHQAIENASGERPADLKVSFFGNTAINYLFVAKQLPWVWYMSIVSNLLVLALVYLPTRKIRPTLTVGLLNFATSVLWLGLLPHFGIGLAITLTLPLIFIFAIGSDYGLHLALNIEDTKDTEETFRTTGKAVLFSAITTVGAFLIFTQMSNVSVQRTMIGTSLAIGVIFLTTILIVPTMYPAKKRKKAGDARNGGAAHGSEAMTRVRVTFKDEAPAAPPTQPHR